MPLRYASLRYPFSAVAICVMRLCVMPFWVMPTFVMAVCVMAICVMPLLRYGCLLYGLLRYSSFRDGHLQNRFVSIQLWIDAFMIWTILFQILIIEFCHRYTSIHRSSDIILYSIQHGLQQHCSRF